ncbi:FecR domain-containing protein [uncultured Mucilaginibacter sp.]|uniref:FecR family protein n=1 Tax=uncultured Mucilaginibacter sp. TaxID=797541 RepID=UPI0025E80B3E|nr:FecR domain-containing protein [uncultured Mucilaginibacter sp.]
MPAIQELFTKYLKNECTDAEISALRSHFGQPENELLLKSIIITELQKTSEHLPEANDTDQRLAAVQERLNKILFTQTSVKAGKSIWKITAIAAAILVAATTGIILFKTQERPVVEVAKGKAVNIIPGVNSATLTLANGKRIKLSAAANGVLAKQNGIEIIKNKEGKLTYKLSQPSLTVQSNKLINKLSTANGEQFTIVLPDGSTVTLNAATSISYPASFTGLPQRNVQLTGEAYFNVVHNDKQPFIVNAAGVQTEDVGTEFNINCYADESSVKTTLIAGAARVRTAQKELMLKPAQQAVATGSNLSYREVDTAPYIAWKNGMFAYHNTALSDVMRQVARWYNVQVSYSENSLKNKRLSGSVSRYDNVEGILNAIGYTAKVKFKVDGTTITVLPE